MNATTRTRAAATAGIVAIAALLGGSTAVVAVPAPHIGGAAVADAPGPHLRRWPADPGRRALALRTRALHTTPPRPGTFRAWRWRLPGALRRRADAGVAAAG
jgi:hypothetical protein